MSLHAGDRAAQDRFWRRPAMPRVIDAPRARRRPGRVTDSAVTGLALAVLLGAAPFVPAQSPYRPLDALGYLLRAKFTAVIALGLLVIAVAFAAAALGNLLGGLRHGSGSWAFGGSGFGEIALVQLTGLVQGMAFGMALLATPAALVLYYVVPNLWSALFSAAALKHAAPWVDLNHAQTPLYTHSITGTGWVQLLAAATIWILVPLVIGMVRVTRTEVKSG